MDSRLFLALWPDSAAVEALAGILAPARQEAADVRWQPPERWHITMAFLKQADPERTIRRVMHVATRLPAPAPIRLGLPGTFGPIIWVGVEHGPWLAELAGGLQEVLRVADRRFRAHVTVGRVRRPEGSARARQVVSMLSPKAGPTWTPTDFTLVASTTGPAPEYRILERWPLSHAPAEEPLPRAGDDAPDRAMLSDSVVPESLEDQ